jgi:hypothetical protein
MGTQRIITLKYSFLLKCPRFAHESVAIQQILCKGKSIGEKRAKHDFHWQYPIGFFFPVKEII